MNTSVIGAGFVWCEVNCVWGSAKNEEEKKILKQVPHSLLNTLHTKWVSGILQENNVVEAVPFLPHFISYHGLLDISSSSHEHGESVFRVTWDEPGLSVKFEWSR